MIAQQQAALMPAKAELNRFGDRLNALQVVDLRFAAAGASIIARRLRVELLRVVTGLRYQKRDQKRP